MEPSLRFFTSTDGARIAYAVSGGGSGSPLVFVHAWGCSIEIDRQSKEVESFMEQLSDDRSVVEYDPRGSGSSQRDIGDSNLQLHTLVADLASLVDHLGLRKFHLIAHTGSYAQCVAYAVQHPDRVSRMVFWAPFARGTDRASEATMAATIQLVRGNWRMARRAMADLGFPNGPVEMQRWMARYLQESIAPEVAARFLEYETRLDLTDLLPRVQAPTLVLHRRGDQYVPISAGRAVAALMPDARFVSLEGNVTYTGWGADEYVGIIRSFLAEGDTRQEASAVPVGTAVILLADIADSTALTERHGDAAFRGRARDLDAALRTIIRDHSGTPIEGKLLGDGVLATFSSARQAIEAALVCTRSGNDSGLPLHLGLHAGDVIRESDPDGRSNVYGGAVNIASRISALSAPGEVLVSHTVRDLARTSAGVSFEDRGEQSLKGVGEPVRVWAIAQQAQDERGAGGQADDETSGEG